MAWKLFIWHSYMCGRTQHVRLGLTKSSIVCLSVWSSTRISPRSHLVCAVTADLVVRLIEQHGLHGHLFADDTQLIRSCRPPDVSALQSSILICLDDVASWM